MKQERLRELIDECSIQGAMCGDGDIYGQNHLYGQLKWAMMRRFKAVTGKSWHSVKAKKP